MNSITHSEAKLLQVLKVNNDINTITFSRITCIPPRTDKL